MVNSYKAALLAALGLAGAVTGQAATYTGDLLIGFTTQSGSDTIVDLGAASSLTSGESWDLSSLLGSYDLSTVNWGVIGDKNVSGTGRLAWSTYSLSGPLASASAWGQLDTATKSIYSNFGTAGAGQSISILATDDNSWNQQTINGALPTQYHNVWGNPNNVGLGSEILYQMLANGSDPVALGSFALGANGSVSFTAVPEPTSYSILGGAGLLLASLRRPLRRKVSS